ncbi:MAG: GldG family protein [Nevskia sp.]|nr:GldG family protein [Nevskia sp.]
MPTNKQQKLVQQVVNGVLIAVVVGLLAWLSATYKLEIDWTYGHRNTLTQASRTFLKSLPDPVKFTAFLDSGADRREYEAWFERYRNAKPNVQIEFVDPARDPARVKQYNVESPGEVVVEYRNRREPVTHLDEREITGALQRLADTSEHFVVFLEGHGERSIAGNSREGYDEFAQAMREKGLKAQGLNLVKTPTIPDNTSILVIARPTQTLLDGEVKIIGDYLAKGGNLLWLTDPDQATGLDALSKTLGITWLDGFAVFPNYQLLGSPNPLIYLAADYPPGPVTRGLDTVTMFPLARALKTGPAGDWQTQPLLQTDDSSWLDTSTSLDSKDKTITLQQKPGDPKGPLTLGATFTRTLKAEGGAPARTQRVAVVGDSDFLANGYVELVGNKQLGLNLMQWLAARDAQLNIDVPKAPDASLYLPGWASLLIAAGYTLLLPALLLGYGITRWARRRRA